MSERPPTTCVCGNSINPNDDLYFNRLFVNYNDRLCFQCLIEEHYKDYPEERPSKDAD